MTKYQPPTPRLDWAVEGLTDQYQQACRDAYHQGFLDGFKATVENQENYMKEIDKLLSRSAT